MLLRTPTLSDLAGGAAVQPLPTISLQEQLARLQTMYADRVKSIAALPATIPQSARDMYNASLIELQNAINGAAAQLNASMQNITTPVQTVVSVQSAYQTDPQYYVSTYIPPSAATQSPAQVIYTTPSPPAPLDNKVHTMQPMVTDYVPAASSDGTATIVEQPGPTGSGPADGAVSVDNSAESAQDSGPAVSTIPWGLLLTLGLAFFS